eukprot:2833923-Amphidinium_carterae.1
MISNPRVAGKCVDRMHMLYTVSLYFSPFIATVLSSVLPTLFRQRQYDLPCIQLELLYAHVMAQRDWRHPDPHTHTQTEFSNTPQSAQDRGYQKKRHQGIGVKLCARHSYQASL